MMFRFLICVTRWVGIVVSFMDYREDSNGEGRL